MANSKRNLTIDIMKGILIILVVVGHSNWEYRSIVYWFHMPVFFMVSGYLLKIPEKGSEKQWILGKCKKLLLPYLAYSLLLSLAKFPYGVKEILIHCVRCAYGGEAVGGVYWYVTVLLISEVSIVIIENRIQKSFAKSLIYAAMYLVGVAESLILIPADTIHLPVYTKAPWNIDVCLMAIPYMMAGKIARNNQGKIIEVLKSTAGTLLICGSTLSLSAILYFSKAINWFTLDMKYSQYKNILLDMVCPLVVASSILLVSKLLSRTGGVVVGQIGQKSLTIMYLHIFIRDYLVIKVFGEQYSVILYLVATVLICMIWDYSIGRLPKIAPLFGVKTYSRQSGDGCRDKKDVKIRNNMRC